MFSLCFGVWAAGQALALEEAALAGCTAWCDGLVAAGLKSARRALRVPLVKLGVAFEAADQLLLTFDLPAGAYATMAVRELLDAQMPECLVAEEVLLCEAQVVGGARIARVRPKVSSATLGPEFGFPHEVARGELARLG